MLDVKKIGSEVRIRAFYREFIKQFSTSRWNISPDITAIDLSENQLGEILTVKDLIEILRNIGKSKSTLNLSRNQLAALVWHDGKQGLDQPSVDTLFQVFQAIPTQVTDLNLSWNSFSIIFRNFSAEYSAKVLSGLPEHITAVHLLGLNLECLYPHLSAEWVACFFEAIPKAVTKIILDERDIGVILDLLGTIKKQIPILIEAQEDVGSSIKIWQAFLKILCLLPDDSICQEQLAFIKKEFEFINNEKKSSDFFLRSVNEYPHVFKRIDDQFQQSRDFALTAVKNNAAVFPFVDTFNKDPDFLLEVVEYYVSEGNYQAVTSHIIRNFTELVKNVNLLTHIKEDLLNIIVGETAFLKGIIENNYQLHELANLLSPKQVQVLVEKISLDRDIFDKYITNNNELRKTRIFQRLCARSENDDSCFDRIIEVVFSNSEVFDKLFPTHYEIYETGMQIPKIAVRLIEEILKDNRRFKVMTEEPQYLRNLTEILDLNETPDQETHYSLFKRIIEDDQEFSRHVKNPDDLLLLANIFKNHEDELYRFVLTDRSIFKRIFLTSGSNLARAVIFLQKNEKHVSKESLNQAISFLPILNLLNLSQIEPRVYNSLIESDCVKVVKARLLALYFFQSFDANQSDLDLFHNSVWYQYLFSTINDMNNTRRGIIEDMLTVYTMIDPESVYELGINQLLSLFYALLPESLIKQIISGEVLESEISDFVDGVEMFFSICQLRYFIEKNVEKEKRHLTSLSFLEEVENCNQAFVCGGINQKTLDSARSTIKHVANHFQGISIVLPGPVHLSAKVRRRLSELLLKNSEVERNFYNQTGRSISQILDQSRATAWRRQCDVLDIIRLTTFAKTTFDLLSEIGKEGGLIVKAIKGAKKFTSNASQICREIENAKSDKDYLCFLSDLNFNRLNIIKEFFNRKWVHRDEDVKDDDHWMPLVKSFLKQLHDLQRIRDELIPIHQGIEKSYLEIFSRKNNRKNKIISFMRDNKTVLRLANNVCEKIESEKTKKTNSLYFLYPSNASRLHTLINFFNQLLTDWSFNYNEQELLSLIQSLLSYYDTLQRFTNIFSETVIVGPLEKEKLSSVRAGNDVGCCMALDGSAAANWICRLSCPSIIVPAVHVATDEDYLRALIWTAKVKFDGKMALMVIFPECQAGIEEDKGNLYLSLLLNWVVQYGSHCGIDKVIFKVPEYGYFHKSSLVSLLIDNATCFAIEAGRITCPSYEIVGASNCNQNEDDFLYLDSFLNGVNRAFFLTPELLNLLDLGGYQRAESRFEKPTGTSLFGHSFLQTHQYKRLTEHKQKSNDNMAKCHVM